jgi:DNA mismatch endonuclease (patch repair protein)
MTKQQRSELMSKIRGKNSGLDLQMRALFDGVGLKYQMYPKLFGQPDFLVGEILAVFCDGSFWHGRNWPKLRAQLASGSNAEYWIEHIRRNRERDREVARELRAQRYRVIRFWDIEVARDPAGCVKKVREALSSERAVRRHG